METILSDAITPTEPQRPLEGLSSPLGSQMFDFHDNGFFSEALQTSEVSSSSGCCFDENSNVNDLSFPSLSFEIGNFGENANNNDNENSNHINNHEDENNNRDETLSIFLDSQQDNENENPTSLPAFPIPSLMNADQHDQFDISTFQPQIPLTDIVSADSGSSFGSSSSEVAPPPQLLLSVLEEEFPSTTFPSYVHLDPPLSSSSAFDESGLSSFVGQTMNAGISVEAYGMFLGNTISELGFQSQELDFQGENGSIYCSESVYSSEDLQVFGESQQQLVVNGCGSPARLASDMSAFEESSYKVRKLSSEERKEKIHRYMTKRNQRNFTKKIKYACRKTLADSRPRVRGRFAKNEEFGVARATFTSNHEDEDLDEVVVKEEVDAMHDSSDIFAHISGVNSFACSYPIQSWM